ncbi:MAG TPA: serine hydrolase [Acidimicrobiia bacterium]|nr:serine hydrolase [Acidimicrobiia bacterium]
MVALVPLPAAADAPWPTDRWPEGSAPRDVESRLTALVTAMATDGDRYGETYAVVVVHHGRVVAEYAGGAIPKWDRPAEPVTPDTKLLSWSTAKSVLHAAVGVLVGRRALRLDEPVPVPEWTDPSDPRRTITLEQLLTMRDGLDFVEDYVDAGISHVMEMLFTDANRDVAHYAASRPLAHEPGTAFNYSSGTSNIVSGIVARAIGPGAPYERFLRDALFEPIGMHSAEARFDEAGTFIGSSYVYATARDFAKFGLLYLRDGVWDGRRVLPAGWVDHARRIRSRDPDDGRYYGAHWWVVGDEHGTFWANGYEGQSILVCPALDLVVTRFGRSTTAHSPALLAWRAAVVDAFARAR